MVFVFYLFFHMSDVCCFTFAIHVHIVNGFLCLIKALNKLILDFSTINCFIKVNPLRSGIFHWIFPSLSCQFFQTFVIDYYILERKEKGVACYIRNDLNYIEKKQMPWDLTDEKRSVKKVRKIEKALNPFFRNCQWQFFQTWYSQKIKL